MLKLINKLILNVKQRLKKKSNLKYLQVITLKKYRSVDIKLMSEFTEVLNTLDNYIDLVQGGKTQEGDREATTLVPMTEEQVWEIRDSLNYLLRHCLKDRRKIGVASVENALAYLDKLKKGNNQLHVLLVVKGLVETGLSVRGYAMQEISPEEWRSCDGRWLIKKLLAGKKYVYDLYLIAGEVGVFAMRCSRKGDAEEILRGTRRI